MLTLYSWLSPYLHYQLSKRGERTCQDLFISNSALNSVVNINKQLEAETSPFINRKKPISCRKKFQIVYKCMGVLSLASTYIPWSVQQQLKLKSNLKLQNILIWDVAAGVYWCWQGRPETCRQWQDLPIGKHVLAKSFTLHYTTTNTMMNLALSLVHPYMGF